MRSAVPAARSAQARRSGPAAGHRGALRPPAALLRATLRFAPQRGGRPARRRNRERLEEHVDLVDVEREVGARQLQHLPLAAQPLDREGKVGARREHDCRPARRLPAERSITRSAPDDASTSWTSSITRTRSLLVQLRLKVPLALRPRAGARLSSPDPGRPRPTAPASSRRRRCSGRAGGAGASVMPRENCASDESSGRRWTRYSPRRCLLREKNDLPNSLLPPLTVVRRRSSTSPRRSSRPLAAQERRRHPPGGRSRAAAVVATRAGASLCGCSRSSGSPAPSSCGLRISPGHAACWAISTVIVTETSRVLRQDSGR